MHRILLEEKAQPTRRPQRRLNPIILDMVKKRRSNEATYTRDHLSHSNSQWNSWKVCIDYKKLNQVTRKDHFPLPFIDQVLERLADQHKTTFTYLFDTFAYIRKSFDLCNTPKHLLEVYDKFRSYFLDSKIIVFSNHAIVKFLLKKPMRNQD
ncbi:hypothetical protein CR513_03089, partial [Mucuna pruriens]